jgi:threonine/homoserine/homoserine lactone efflux protein
MPALVLPSPAAFGLFLAAAVSILLIPGPAVLYIVGRAIAQGRRAGFVSSLGIAAATLAHICAAAAGLSAMLASSAFAFTLVKYAGAGYLIWLGLKALFARPPAADLPPVAHRGGRLFRDGFVVNLLNPKTALFFLAFLPQFVDPARGHVASQVVVLGLTFAALGLMSDGCYVLLAGSIRAKLLRSRARAFVERQVSGVLYIGLGLTAALSRSHSK